MSSQVRRSPLAPKRASFTLTKLDEGGGVGLLFPALVNPAQPADFSNATARSISCRMMANIGALDNLNSAPRRTDRPAQRHRLSNPVRSTLPEPPRLAFGLHVKALLDRNQYETGNEVSALELKQVKLRKHNVHPDWNFTISPVAGS